MCEAQTAADFSPRGAVAKTIGPAGKPVDKAVVAPCLRGWRTAAAQERWRATASLLILSIFAVAHARASDAHEPLHTDSRSPYVHRLTLYDVDGTAISPEDVPAPPPYSPKATCGKCHPVGAIGGGWHFNAGLSDADPGRPGEPWILSIPELGMSVPLSYRGWPGTFKPAQLGFSDWDFSLRFGHHHPGGGVSDPNQLRIDSSDEMTRWNISGTREIDCMICHAADQRHDPAEAERQLEDENLKWIPTAALGLGVIQGAAKNVPDDYDPFMPNPDMPGGQPPTVQLDASRFDFNERVFFNITRDIPSDRCYFCHTTRIVEREANGGGYRLTPLERQGVDVHLAAGLECVDCHRNGIEHDIVRGYAGEAAQTGETWRAALSCEGCHLGVEGAVDADLALGGRYGAPHPQHRGLPPIHFEKLTCTACHSGPWPQMRTARTQTALNHGLGLASRERGAGDSPPIVTPVFLRQADGKIAPQRLIWPEIWGWLDGDALLPATPRQVEQAIKTAGANADGARLGQTAIADVLQALTADPNRPAAYFAAGALHRIDDDGKLVRGAAPGRAYAWPLAHDVRPAAQSLGVRGCTDCHGAQGAIYFGQVATQIDMTQTADLSMLALRGDRVLLNRVWAALYPLRPAMKWFGWLCLAVVLYALLWGRPGKTDLPYDPPSQRISVGVLAFATAILAVTGCGALLVFGRLTGWALLLHTGVAPLMLLGLVGLVAATRKPSCAGEKWLLLLGLLAAGTMLAAMLPLFGYAAQETLLYWHRYSGLAFVAVFAIYLVLSRRAGAAQGAQSS